MKVGWVVVGDVRIGKYRRIDVVVSVPEGWLPEDPDDDRSELLSCPRFVDGERFEVGTPIGVVKRFSVLGREDG